MSITVDHRPFCADHLNLNTIGQLLAHLHQDNKLVVHVLVDGAEPDMKHIRELRAKNLADHILFIETADPRALAHQVLDEVSTQLDHADHLCSDASNLLTRNSSAKAMEKLSGCFSTWQHAQESVLKVAQLLRIDLNDLAADGVPMTQLLADFTVQLHDIKRALENRDFVSLNDILKYEATSANVKWCTALNTLRGRIAA